MEPVAIYRRAIAASVTRIWENVLDWEHLPWLHRDSFLGVELLEQESEGFRAWVTLPPAAEARRALIEVRLNRPQRHYWTRTVAGTGAGSEILTTLNPVGERTTDITVEFFLPGLPAERAAFVGEAYTRLYAQLWDEDEAMMVRRQEILDRRTPANSGAAVLLGSLAALRARLPLAVGTGDGAFRLVEVDGEIIAHRLVCPHRGGPLEESAVCDGILTCPWHGYRFDLRTGRSADGRSLHLGAAPRLEVDADGIASLVS